MQGLCPEANLFEDSSPVREFTIQMNFKCPKVNVSKKTRKIYVPDSYATVKGKDLKNNFKKKEKKIRGEGKAYLLSSASN